MTRLAVVTGVAGGIGRACAAAFTAAGWDVAGIDRVERPDGLVATRYERIDLGTRAATDRLRALFADLGRLDVLVNNAALQIARPLAETSDDDWAAVLATNAAAPFAAIREAMPYLRASGGAVVNVVSVHALATSAGLAAYASSKGALLALTRSAAVELGPMGIRVNAVLPGAVDTPMLRNDAVHRGADRAAEVATDAGADAGADHAAVDPLAALARRTPLRRIGRPEEIASAVLFLADNDRSSFITGQALVVDGGVLARLATE